MVNLGLNLDLLYPDSDILTIRPARLPLHMVKIEQVVIMIYLVTKTILHPSTAIELYMVMRLGSKLVARSWEVKFS